jgi:Putative zinc-finger
MKCTETRCTDAAATEMRCREAKLLFSPYLDGAVTGTQMLALERHLARCAGCCQIYESLCRTQRLLSTVKRPKVPADLGLKLRLAISREVAQARRPPMQGMMVRLENALNAFMVPATAGFLSALVIFGIVMAYFVVPAPLRANNSNDVPLIMVNTEPELEQSGFASNLSTINADSLVIEAYVDANGRVQDYRILSDPGDSKDVLPAVKRMLIFTTFRPALSMGVPTSSHAVLSFSKISVRG